MSATPTTGADATADRQPRATFPVVHLPTVVLPGAVVTLALNDDARRSAVEAATSSDNQLVLTGGDERDLGVLAQVPNVGQLPNGDAAAIVSVERRAHIVGRRADAGVEYVDIEAVADVAPTARVDAATRELRATLEVIAELRNSRRLPEILRTTSDPGGLADAVAVWAEFADADRLVVLRAVDVADRVDAIHAWARRHVA